MERLGALRERLGNVLDPELDESILELGFVEALDLCGGEVTVRLRLPTYWCSPNFVFLMAEDARRALLGAEGVRSVTVRIEDHCDSESFREAYPEEAQEELDELRRVFWRKAFLRRQAEAIENLLDCGIGLEAIGKLKVREAEGEKLRRYLERRARLGLSCEADDPLVVDVEGREVPSGRLREHLRAARAARLTMEVGSAFCTAVLEARRQGLPQPLVQIGGLDVPAR